jgi:predicted transcriptional regulator
MSLQLILNDGTAIDIVEAGVTKHFVVTCANADSFKDIWDMMTDENLSEVQIVEEGTVIHTIVGMTLNGTQTVENTDGTLTGHFYMDGGVYVEDEYSKAGHILLGEEG